MSQPQPLPHPSTDPEQPEPVPSAEPDIDASPDGAATETDPPLSRAARRAKGTKAEPSHVGPRGGRARPGRGARSHTKRRSG